MLCLLHEHYMSQTHAAATCLQGFETCDVLAQPKAPSKHSKVVMFSTESMQYSHQQTQIIAGACVGGPGTVE